MRTGGTVYQRGRVCALCYSRVTVVTSAYMFRFSLCAFLLTYVCV